MAERSPVARRVIRGSSVKRRVVPRLSECHVIIGRAIAETVVAPDDSSVAVPKKRSRDRSPARSGPRGVRGDPHRRSDRPRRNRLVELAILQVQQLNSSGRPRSRWPGKRPRRTRSRRGSLRAGFVLLRLKHERALEAQSLARGGQEIAHAKACLEGLFLIAGIVVLVAQIRADIDIGQRCASGRVGDRLRQGTPGQKQREPQGRVAPIARTCASRARRMPGAQPGSP
jgi:hypothetical protein